MTALLVEIKWKDDDLFGGTNSPVYFCKTIRLSVCGAKFKGRGQLSAFVLSTDRKEEASWRGSFLTEMQGKTFKLQGVRGCRGARGRTSRPPVKAINFI